MACSERPGSRLEGFPSFKREIEVDFYEAVY